MKLNIKIDIPQNQPNRQFQHWQDLCLEQLKTINPINKSTLENHFKQVSSPLIRSALAKLLAHWSAIEHPPADFSQWPRSFRQLQNQSIHQTHLFIKPLNQIWTSNELNIKIPLPSPFKLSLPTMIHDYQFHGVKKEAISHQLNIANQCIQIISAKEKALKTRPFEVDEMVRALSALPLQILRLIDKVILNPIADPEDLHLAQQGYESHHRALMAMLNKQVTIYPSNQQTTHSSIEAIYRALFHETAHQAEELETLSEEQYIIWKKQWKLAIANDGPFFPSEYAEQSNDISEDFAESFALYFLTRSTIVHQEYQILFPSRMTFIKQRYDS